MDEILDIIESVARRRMAEGKDITFKFLTDQVPEATPTELIVAIHNAETKPCKDGEIDCPLCGNKRYIEKLDSNGFWVTQICSCAYKNAENRRLIKNGFDKTWDDYTVNEYWQRELLKKAQNFVKSKEAWFYVGGQSGAGKTLICSVIANDFLFNQRKKVLYLTWTDFIGRIKRDLMSDNALSAKKEIEKAKTAEILFIDELLKTHTDTDLKYFVEIINYRYTNQLKTIITSELSADELMRIDEATFGRMLEMTDRGKYYIQILKDRNKNQRLKIVNT